MFYALATRKIPSNNLKFRHVLEDIETLNQKALVETYDITAISFHAYAYLADRYLLLPCGASFGDRYGPVVVSRGRLARSKLAKKRVAVPGRLTTACLVLRILEPNVELVETRFDKILETVASGHADAGVVIHEGQLTYSSNGLSKVMDLGEVWHRETGLPLPLGGSAIRRSLAPHVSREAVRLVGESIRYGLAHREEALAYAIQFGRGMDTATADRFVSMYVNEWTLDFGERGRKAVQVLFDRGFEAGVLPRKVRAEFVD